MWGKPKTELCLSLTQRYSEHLDAFYVCNSPFFPLCSFLFCLSHSLPVLALSWAECISPLLSHRPTDRLHKTVWQNLASVSPDTLIPSLPWIVVCALQASSPWQQKKSHSLGTCTAAPPGGRHSSVHFEQPTCSRSKQHWLHLPCVIWFCHE